MDKKTTDYVLEPILRVLEDGRDMSSSEIREQAADRLGYSKARREHSAPGSRSPVSEFKNHVAHGLKGLQKYGHLEKLSTGNYRLTGSGAELAASSRSLTPGDIKNKRPSRESTTAGGETTVRPQTESGVDLRAAWEAAGKKVEEDEEAPTRIADRTAMLEEVQTWPDADRSSREFMELLWFDQRVLGDLGHGEYELTGALDSEQFRSEVAIGIGAVLADEGEPRVTALQEMAENVMALAQQHGDHADTSGQVHQPAQQTWRLMTALFPNDFCGVRRSGHHIWIDHARLFKALGGSSASTAGKHRWILDRLAEVAAPGSGFSARDGLTAASHRMEQVQQLFRIVKEDEPANDVDPRPGSYATADALIDLFLPEQRFRDILGSIRSRKNLILQGPPGVGKTFIAKRLAYCLIGRKDDRPVEMVQFHQSYAYEDFVQGFRPTEEGGFRRRDGVFFEFCERAEADRETPHVFIIDEINRGNLSRIFGELLMLLEADKRGPEHAVRLTYQDANEDFSVPENVYILGLMNTADRSLAVVDYALRRRFAFEALEPQFDQKFQDHLRGTGVACGLIDRIAKDIESLNETIRGDEDLGHGFEIGHSYFVPHGNEKADENWRRHRVRSQILPLLREYWFDRQDDVRAWEKRLLESPDGD